MRDMRGDELQKMYRVHRPLFHFTSGRGWLNDPNGLIFYGGYYHLFYQHYPDGVTHGAMHWGHARTKDFLEWEELPIALYPDELGVIFSGCMVYDENNTSGLGTGKEPPLVAVFTHHLEAGGLCVQYQSLAYSLNGGMTFTKYRNNPVLDLHLKDFRDPKVFWYKADRRWVLLLAAGKEILFFTSPDLKDWTPGGSFCGMDLEGDEIWECPDLVELENGQGEKKWVLFVSQNTLDYIQTGIRYYVGTFDGEKFEAEEGIEKPLLLDFGRDNYAAATYSGTGSRVIQQSWMNCWRYAEKIPEAGFRGSMTLPRELGLEKTSSGYRVFQRPVREAAEKLRKSLRVIPDDAAIETEILPGIYQYAPGRDTGEILFCNQENSLRITVDFRFGKIVVDRSGCGGTFCDPCFQETGWKYFDVRAERTLYVILDVASIEVFAAGGEATGTFQYFVQKPFEKILTGREADEGK